MKFFHEVKDIKAIASKDIRKVSKGFENAQNDVKAARHIDTIRQDLDGKTYPGTEVAYKKHTFRLEGEKVEGVFPVFQSKFDVRLPPDLRLASDTEQFKYCTRRLGEQIERYPSLAEKFTPRQLEQIKAGEPRISGLTWHHNELPGKMQLVDAKEHRCPHTGGRSIWGGGADNR